MSLTVLTIPCRTDNYAFIIHNKSTNETALVDVPESKPILQELQKRGWGLDNILITHHHFDHVEGLDDLRREFNPKVYGNQEDSSRLPKLDEPVSDGQIFTICSQEFQALDVSGHTVGHLAFITDGSAFTADSLMALGCGRVFEGTFPMMWNSLNKLAKLPKDTIIYSGHEYTLANGQFAITIEPDNKDLIARIQRETERRKNGIPTVPSTLEEELKTNPFLRADHPEVKRKLNMEGDSAVDVFAEIRSRKDSF